MMVYCSFYMGDKEKDRLSEASQNRLLQLLDFIIKIDRKRHELLTGFSSLPVEINEYLRSSSEVEFDPSFTKEEILERVAQHTHETLGPVTDLVRFACDFRGGVSRDLKEGTLENFLYQLDSSVSRQAVEIIWKNLAARGSEPERLTGDEIIIFQKAAIDGLFLRTVAPIDNQEQMTYAIVGQTHIPQAGNTLSPEIAP